MITHDDLEQFHGTENYYTATIRNFVYTDGIHFLLEKANCYWLMDAIVSYQNKLSKDNELKFMQFWDLKVNEDKSAVLTCVADSGRKPAVTQNIEFTDFPLSSVRIWVEQGSIDGINSCMVAMLPGER